MPQGKLDGYLDKGKRNGLGGPSTGAEYGYDFNLDYRLPEAVFRVQIRGLG